MALDPATPFGLHDIKLFPLSGETPGVGVDLPVARTFSFSEAEDFEELRGDDGVAAVRGLGASVDWELEGGGISFEAVKTMYGGTIIETGTTPNQIKTFRKLSDDTRPYFRVEGQAISDSGGDFHVILYRCRCTGELSGGMEDGSWWLTGASGRAIGRVSDKRLYDFVQNETATEIVTTVNEVQQVTVDATGGTFTLTYSGQTTGNIAYNAAASAVQTALEALSNIDVGDVSVSGSAGGPWDVTFTGALGGTNVAQMTADSTNLTGGSSSAAVNTLVTGG